MSTWTPWGKAQSSKRIARGIVQYSTAGHGGYHVSATVNATMPAALRLDNGKHGDGWYEEDIDWCRVVLAFPALYTPEQARDAASTLGNWAPEDYEAHFGVELPEEMSLVKRERAFKARTRDMFVTTAAWGSWHETVPDGFVGVVSKRESDGAERWALVPDAAYVGNYIVRDEDRVWENHP